MEHSFGIRDTANTTRDKQKEESSSIVVATAATTDDDNYDVNRLKKHSQLVHTDRHAQKEKREKGVSKKKKKKKDGQVTKRWARRR